MGCRREERVNLRLRTVVSGVDRNGRAFREYAETLDFSMLGARLAGLRARLEPGAVVSLLQGDRCARFRVTWIGDPGTATDGQIGLRCIEVAHRSNKRILYIDDQEYELSSRAGLLRSGGYDVVTDRTAEAAWQELIQSRFDLLLLDYPLADADALAVVTAVKRYWPEIRILLATGNPARVPESLLALVDDCIHKGIVPAELLTRVSGLIGDASRLNWPVSRSTPRHALNVPVSLRIFRGGVPVTLQGRSTDLSTSGMGIEVEEPVMPGEVGTLYFRLPSTNGIQFSPRVMVRRKNRTHCGLEFVDITSVEETAIACACGTLPQAASPTEA